MTTLAPIPSIMDLKNDQNYTGPDMYPYSRASIFQFKNVVNAAELTEHMKTGNADLPDIACLDATRVVSIDHLRVALSKALVAKRRGAMKSHNIYSEIIHSFSGDNNVSDSFKRFGISKKSSNIICIVLQDGEDTQYINKCRDQLNRFVNGEACDQICLDGLADYGVLRKVPLLKLRFTSHRKITLYKRHSARWRHKDFSRERNSI